MPRGSERADRGDVSARPGSGDGSRGGSALGADGRPGDEGDTRQGQHRDDADGDRHHRAGQQGGDDALGRGGGRLAVTAEAPAALEATAPLESTLPPDREERRHGADQAEQALADRPPLVDPEQDRDEAEGDEDDTVDESEDLDAELGGARDVL